MTDVVMCTCRQTSRWRSSSKTSFKQRCCWAPPDLIPATTPSLSLAHYPPFPPFLPPASPLASLPPTHWRHPHPPCLPPPPPVHRHHRTSFPPSSLSPSLPALWFLFLLAYGGLPIDLASDLHRLFTGTIANALFFWLTIVIVPGACILPTFAARQLRRYLRPEYYQLVQEVAARERAGEVVAAGGGAGRSGKQLTGMMARASRLMQRKVRGVG